MGQCHDDDGNYDDDDYDYDYDDHDNDDEQLLVDVEDGERRMAMINVTTLIVTTLIAAMHCNDCSNSGDDGSKGEVDGCALLAVKKCRLAH